MTSFIFKILTPVILSFAILAGGILPSQAEPLINNADEQKEKAKEFGQSASFNPSFEVGSIIAMAIGVFLSLLAIIFIILILVAGHKWMTAGGNEEKVKEAKSQLRHAVIGLAIIIVAYAITNFVFEGLGGAAGGGSGPTSPSTSG